MNFKLFLMFVGLLFGGLRFAFAQSPVTVNGAAACNGAAVAGTWTVPCGVTSITVEVYGGGGGAGGGGGGSNGGLFNTRGGGGAGGGGYTTRTINVIPGTVFNYSVGAGGCGGGNGGDGSSGGNGTAGGSSSFTGMDAASTPVALTANGGARGSGGSGTEGSPGSGGAGGSASGGTTNTTGTAGSSGSGGSGGSGGTGAGPAGGAGGVGNSAAGAQYGGGGAGGGNGGGGAGARGGLIITYTVSAAIPTPTISSTPPSCVADGSSTISNYDPALTYIFTPSGPTVGAGGAISGMTIGTSYTVEASIAGCNSSPSASFSNAAATPTPTVTAQAMPSNILCEGATLNLVGGSSGTITGWGWSGPDGFTATTQSPSIPSVTVAASGTYTLIGNSACGPTAPVTVNVTVNPNPTATISGSLSYCVGGNTTLTASGGTAYSWSNSSTNASITVTAGTYVVTVSDASSCSATASANVTESINLAVNITGNLSYCPGGSTTITANGGTSWSWSNSNTNASITVTSGTYSVTASDGTGCTGTASATVTANPNPTPTISGSLNYCPGANTTLTANGGVSYVWNDPGNSTTSNVMVTQGSYTVTATDANGCTGTANATVTERTPPTVTISGLLSYCVGGNTTLTANGGVSYVWDDPSSSTTASVTVTQGTYTVTATDASGCTGTASETVTETTSIPVFVSSPTTMCTGATATITASGATNYVWSNGGTGASTTVTAAGTYTVTGTDAGGCTGTATADVIENTPLPIDLGNDISVCADATVTLNVPNGYTNYVWSNGRTTPSITVTTSGTYSLTVADANGCTASDDVDVTITPFPVVNLGANQRVYQGTELTLSSSVTPDEVGGVYVWTPSTLLSCTDCASPSTIVENTITYTLVYTNANGCSGTDSITITAVPEGRIYFPNAFSPNGDGVNDIYIPYGKNMKRITYSIFNRWGEKVFESNSELIGWDGFYKGVQQPAGTYPYTAKITFLDATTHDIKGSITIIR